MAHDTHRKRRCCRARGGRNELTEESSLERGASFGWSALDDGVVLQSSGRISFVFWLNLSLNGGIGIRFEEDALWNVDA